MVSALGGEGNVLDVKRLKSLLDNFVFIWYNNIKKRAKPKRRRITP